MAGGGMAGWRTFGERVIFEDPAVWMGQVDVGLPGGERVWLPAVRIMRSAAIVLADDDQVLLVWRHRFLQDRWGWELPGGLVDEDEEPADAAQREMEEETGYRAGQIEPLITCQLAVGMADAEHHVFTVRDGVRAGEPTSLAESVRVEWVPLARVPGLISARQIWAAGSLVGLLQYMTTGAQSADGD